jgi:hypothetical protein
LQVALDPGQSTARVHYEWKASAARRVKSLVGPNLYVGDGTAGEGKSWGLFPGLEYLFGPERSSNPRDFAPPLDDRRTPRSDKITVPLMAVTLGPESQPAPMSAGRFFAPDSLKDQHSFQVKNRTTKTPGLKTDFTVALSWDPLQRWDGAHAFPSARFASPNFDEGMSNHRLGLFLPSTPEFVAENADRAGQPWPLPGGKSLTLDANLAVVPGPALGALREWLGGVGGLPRPNPWPRSFQQELEVCRSGFLKTVWNEEDETWRHCIGWAGSDAPGFADHVAGAKEGLMGSRSVLLSAVAVGALGVGALPRFLHSGRLQRPKSQVRCISRKKSGYCGEFICETDRPELIVSGALVTATFAIPIPAACQYGVSPYPSGNSGVLPSPLLIGSSVTTVGQLTGSLPENPEPKSTSVMPPASVPGSQAATKARTLGS